MKRTLLVGMGLVLVGGVATPAVTPMGANSAAAVASATIPCDFDGDGFADLAAGIPFEGVRGVNEVKDFAYPAQQARIDLALGKAVRAGTTPAQIMQAIAGGNLSIPGGPIDVGSRRFNVQTSGTFASLPALADTVVGGGKGAVVRLGDVAEVALRPAPGRGSPWRGGAALG